MAIKNMKDKDTLRYARERVETLFREQCANGQQTKELNDNAIAACGQFVGPNAHDVGQRGHHGTAAAIKVLSQVDDRKARALVPKLISYAARRKDIEKGLRATPEDAGRAEYKCSLDEHNVIKLGEMLDALSFAQQAGVSVENQIQAIVANLHGGIREDKGWHYFTDEQLHPELLPTAYALMGLAQVGAFEEAAIAEQFLRSALLGHYRASNVSATDSQTHAIHVTCLYALTFRKRADGQAATQGLEDIFKHLWRRSAKEMQHDDEQNVEYWREMKKTCYVRVPWQLYMIALAAHYDFGWKFSRSICQRALERAVNAACGSGFIYPYSGQRPSARTNAILHEVLKRVETVRGQRNLPVLPRVAEVTMDAFRSKIASVLFLLFAMILAACSLYQAFSGQTSVLAQLRPEIMGAGVLFLGSTGVNGLRRRGEQC